MNYTSDLAVLLPAYVLILLVITIAGKIRPGMVSYLEPKAENLAPLTVVHILLICVMMAPSWIMASVPLGLLQFNVYTSWGMLLFMLFIALTLISVTGKKEAGEKRYAMAIRKGVLPYAISRIVFLAVYEWFFRGMLLSGLVNIAGNGVAITINIALYALAHFHKSRNEILGCIPFGILLSVFTLMSQSIWPAVAIHLLLAVKFESPGLLQFPNPVKKYTL